MPVTKGDDRHQFVPWESLEARRVHRVALSLSSSRRKSKLLANRQSYVAEQRRLIKGEVYLLLFSIEPRDFSSFPEFFCFAFGQFPDRREAPQLQRLLLRWQEAEDGGQGLSVNALRELASVTRSTSSIPQPIFRAAADGRSQDIDKCALMSIEIKQIS